LFRLSWPLIRHQIVTFSALFFQVSSIKGKNQLLTDEWTHLKLSQKTNNKADVHERKSGG